MPLKKEIEYEKSFASHEKAKYWSDKNELKPNEVFCGSRKKAWFTCECGHDYLHTISSVANGSSCPYCCKFQKKVCGEEQCMTCYEKSFAKHEKSKYWSDNNSNNPYDYLLFSQSMALFKCTCGHEFTSAICNISLGQWCPYCSSFTRKLCGDANCLMCFNKSFASHEKSKYWSNKNKLFPINVALNSHEKYLFNCNGCNHEIKLSLLFINSGGWCAICYGKKICLDNKCIPCFNKSFASNEKFKYWSDKNKLKPREVIKGSRQKIIFVCEKKHEFTTKLSLINGGSWCPMCCNKSEELVFNKLKTIYKNIKTQFKPERSRNIKTKSYLPFDFVLEEQKIIIELDGPQHFKQISYWCKPEEVQKRDILKMQYAKNNNFSVIRITQEYVVKKNSKWFDELIVNIEKVINDSKVQNIYICKKDEYKIYQEE